MNKIKSTTFGSILVDKRHVNIHRQPIEVIPFMKLMFGHQVSEIEFEVLYKAKKELFKELNPQYPHTVFHTEQMAYIDVRNFCVNIIKEMKDLVSETHNLFPNEISNAKF